MNELTFEDFSKLKKEEQLNKLKEEYKNNKTNEGELKICNLLSVHQLNKKQLKLIFQADRMFFSTNVRKFLDICEEKFSNDLPITFSQNEIKDIGVITLLASVMEINASADMLVEYLNLVILEWARNKFEELRTVPTTESALERMNDMIKAIEGTVSNTKYYNISDDIMSMFEYYDNATKVMRTGIKSFDSYFLLEPTDVLLLGGQSGTGKTAFSLQLADGLVNNGNRGIFFSLEMNNIQLYRRLIAMKGNINISKLMTSESFSNLSKTEYNKFNEAVGKIKTYGDRLVMCYEAQTLMDIISITKKENSKKKLDFIVVDYVQLVSHKAASEVQRITEISLELKRLAKELGIVVIGLSQLSRKKTDGTDMTALKGSSQLENDASQILILKSEFEDEEEQDTDDLKSIVANVNKNRNGRVGKYRMMFNKPMQKFIDTERRK